MPEAYRRGAERETFMEGPLETNCVRGIIDVLEKDSDNVFRDRQSLAKRENSSKNSYETGYVTK